MNSNSRQRVSGNFTAMFPAILRITLSLLLWTLGAANMNLTSAQTQPNTFPLPLDKQQIDDSPDQPGGTDHAARHLSLYHRC